jgi:hypothetical protein
MSIVDLYSVESKFNEKKKEYVSLMDSINYSCLGKEKKNKECLRAARLNAEMQSCLIRMSNLIPKKMPPKPIQVQHAQLLKISDKLETDLKELVQNESIQSNTSSIVEMNKTNAFVWGIGAIVVVSLVVYQYKKI